MGKIERDDARFPKKLRDVRPVVKQVWWRGEWKREIFLKCCAVVGSRKMSRYGKQVLSEIIPKLCASGYTIVSGLMYGVDQEAHKLTLECGGRVIGVLGWGIEAHAEEGAERLIEKIVKSGGVILSEYPGSTSARIWTFPQRNRIVVALSEMVIVVEAGERSGSLNTASWARRMQKPVYAVSGGIFSPTSVGTNNLIAMGIAKAMTVEELNHLCRVVKNGQTVDINSHKLSEGEREIVMLLKIEGPMGVNEIARSLGENVGEILGRLMKMEMRGVLAEERSIWKVV